jgi:rubrerythrin
MENSNFINSQTYQNLINAYNRDLVESAKFQMSGDYARREGYHQISNVFYTSSGNETRHAERWLRFVIQSDELPPTLSNLQDAAKEVYYEGTDLYTQYAQIAREEGYTDIANTFDAVALIERHHYYTFNRLAENIQNNQVFCKTTSTVWICIACGNLVWSDCAPDICPVCQYPQGYYEVNCDNF